MLGAVLGAVMKKKYLYSKNYLTLEVTSDNFELWKSIKQSMSKL